MNLAESKQKNKQASLSVNRYSQFITGLHTANLSQKSSLTYSAGGEGHSGGHPLHHSPGVAAVLQAGSGEAGEPDLTGVHPRHSVPGRLSAALCWRSGERGTDGVGFPVTD